MVQLMTEEEARNYKLNPFDLTKVWYHKDFPLHEVGVLELNRNPENYYADVEQAAFNPMNIVEGIGFSPDKMLQGRLFSYGDAQRYRLGVNHTEIPVNRPRCPIHAFHRDGQMRTDGNYGSAKGYEPNSYGEWQDTPALKEPPLAVNGDVYGTQSAAAPGSIKTSPTPVSNPYSKAAWTTSNEKDRGPGMPGPLLIFLFRARRGRGE